jgi:ubiquinone/menaquinone biosynthesis C-methylase UbiE
MTPYELAYLNVWYNHNVPGSMDNFTRGDSKFKWESDWQYGCFEEPLREYVRKGAAVLDFACGEGFLLERMAKHHPEAHFLGIDSAENIGKSRERTKNLSNVAFLVNDDDPVLTASSFDLVYSGFDFIGTRNEEQRLMTLVLMRHYAKHEGYIALSGSSTSDGFAEYRRQIYTDAGHNILSIDKSKIKTDKAVFKRHSIEDMEELFKRAYIRLAAGAEGTFYTIAIGNNIF